MLKNGNILGWPNQGYPNPQGPYYCGVGSDEVIGRNVVEEHLQACIDANLLIFGINAEVMLGQWEFQIGYRGFAGDPKADPLTTSDHLWLARWLLYRTGEKYNIYATLDPKPKKGDWNGSGCHTNFSIKDMRNPTSGMIEINSVVDLLDRYHVEHQEVYGYDNEARLTGDHETSHYKQFKAGKADRGASIRIPRGVVEKGCGYVEDRRPAANMDPYLVTERILRTIIKWESS